jgi:hypothetical protein
VANGRVEDGGAFDETFSKGLTDKLQLDIDSGLQAASDTEITGAKETAAQVAKTNQREDLARATGDVALYRYYFRAVGVLPSLVFVGFVIMNVFCNSFGRKYFPRCITQR